MPKKFGTNDKVEAAREREQNKKENAKSQKAKADEDAKWVDNDKGNSAKQQRAEAKAEKEREAQARAAEKAALRRAEEAELAKNQPPKKVTHFQIQRELERTLGPRKPADPTEEQPFAMMQLEINNRREGTGELSSQPEEVSASGISAVHAALAEVVDSGEIDLHPEKRMKAAYSAYCERTLPILKVTNPGMRLSQYKQMMFENWKKCPENPLLQAQMKAMSLKKET